MDRDRFSAMHPLYLELIAGNVIRIVELLPGAPNDPITLRLSIHELEHAPDYEALSYVWGDANNRTPIQCNGKTLRVTANLAAALRRIRYPDPNRSRFIWVDAICINQGNDREKSHHVAFMNHVYRDAKRVLIFTGDDVDGEAKIVMSLITEHTELKSRFTSVSDMPKLTNDDSALNDPRWRSLGRFMKCVWFSRAWVLQEAGVAKDPLVLYGSSEFSYRELMQLTRWIVKCAPQLETKAGISLLTIHTDWQDWSDNWRATQDYTYGLIDLLSHAKGLGFQDRRDHVYAFLGHPLLQKEDGSGPIIQPNYGLNVTEVFWQLTAQVSIPYRQYPCFPWLKRCKILPKFGLAVLSAVEHDEQTFEENTPSWIVRWDMDIIQNSMGYYAHFCYQASGQDEREPPISLEGDHRVLQAKSILVDAIETVYQFPAGEEHWQVEEATTALKREEVLNEILDDVWAAIHSTENLCAYSAPELARDAFTLSLCAGLTNYECAEADNTALAQHRANFDAFWAVRNEVLGRAGDNPSSADRSRGRADQFWYNLSLSCKGRCLFITKKGYYGLGPWIMKAGDECHILKGARVPFVLRKADDGLSLKVVGEAYLHGIMHGEFFNDGDGDAWVGTDLT
jgi:hypothetical protein